MLSFISRIFKKKSEKQNAKPADQSDINLTIECIDWITSTMSATDSWRRGFAKMKSDITQHPNSYGMNLAWENWQSMQGGYGSWSDYYIPNEDFETQRKLNEELQSYCTALSLTLSSYSTK